MDEKLYVNIFSNLRQTKDVAAKFWLKSKVLKENDPITPNLSSLV